MNHDDKNISLPWFGIPKIIPYAKPYFKTLIFMIILGIISSLIDSVYPLFNRYAINHFIAEGTLDTLPLFIVSYLAVLIFQTIDNFVTTYYCGKIEMGVDRDLRNASFNHLQTLSFSYFNQNNVGYIHARVMSDTGRIGELVAWRMMDIVWNGSYIISVLAVMLSINARLAMYVLILVPIAVAIISYFQKHLVTLNRRIREINSTITGNFNDTGQG